MVWLQPWMATSQILKEMFYGLVAAVGDNFSTVHMTLQKIACLPRFSNSGVKKTGGVSTPSVPVSVPSISAADR